MRIDQVDAHLGGRIAAARREAGLDLSDLAKAIDISQAELIRMEQGQVRIRAIHIARLSRQLGKSIGWFYSGLPGQIPLDPKFK